MASSADIRRRGWKWPAEQSDVYNSMFLRRVGYPRCGEAEKEGSSRSSATDVPEARRKVGRESWCFWGLCLMSFSSAQRFADQRDFCCNFRLVWGSRTHVAPFENAKFVAGTHFRRYHVEEQSAGNIRSNSKDERPHSGRRLWSETPNRFPAMAQGQRRWL